VQDDTDDGTREDAHQDKHDATEGTFVRDLPYTIIRTLSDAACDARTPTGRF